MDFDKKSAILVTVLICLSMPLLVLAATSDEETTVSNVTIQQYVAISMNTNLSLGILFGTVDPGILENNASHNYDDETQTNTTMWLSIDTDSNINVDFCIKDDAALTKGGDTIPNTNYTYVGNNTINGNTMNDVTSSVNITTVYSNFGDDNLAPGNKTYMQFWLDIPVAQTPGLYVNNVNFKGIVTGASC